MAAMTQETLRSMIREVAGEVAAEKMAESQARGKEIGEKGGDILDFQRFVAQLTANGGSYQPSGAVKAALPGDRFFRTLGAVVAGMGKKDSAVAWIKDGAKDLDVAGRAVERGVFKANAQVIERDLSSVIQDQGAILIREEVSDDFIEFLRPAQVLTGLGARDVPMQSTELIIPAQVTGSTGGWFGEGEPIQVTAPGFGGVEMRLRSYGSIVPIPNDLLRYAFNNAEAFVAADMRLDIATAMDLAHLRGSGVNGQPLGIRWRGRVTQSLGNSTDNIINDLVGIFVRMGEASIPMQRMGFALNFRVWQRLYTLRDGIGGFLFKDEMNNGTIMGQPFRRSSVLKSNLDPYASGTFNKTELYGMDMDTVMIGRADGVAILVSQEAAYEQNGVVKSSFSRNQTVVRAIIKTDVQLRYRDGVQLVDGIDWINH